MILAGGRGTRLGPLTEAVNKHLIPVYDKPMIFYPLTNLILLGVRDIAIVSSENDLDQIRLLLGDGSHLGIDISYFSQDNPLGVVDGLKSAADFIRSRVCVVQLGDNFFFGSGIIKIISNAIELNEGATVFTYPVSNPSAFGVLNQNSSGGLAIEEKPANPKSNKAVTGLYVFMPDLIHRIDSVEKSSRGEYEITELLNSYIEDLSLRFTELPRGSAWLDLGTLADLGHATKFVEAIQSRQGMLVGSPEEASLSQGWITKKDLKNKINQNSVSEYYRALMQIVKE